MFTIKNQVVAEQIINKSRFICNLIPVESEDDAKEKLLEIKKKHYDATHNCYSYIVGESGQISKNSDDGEPSQTAGVVIYDVLKKNELTNVLAVVTRYFGGIKLGAGGLVRAYSSSTAMAVEISEKVKLIKYQIMDLTYNYSYMNIVSKYIEPYEILDKDFGTNITFTIKVPEADINELKNTLIDLTKNSITINLKK